MNDNKRVFAVDVGSNSLGVALVELDGENQPVALLESLSFIHDSGVDPGSKKTGDSRKAIAGLARRMRRLGRRKTRRLKELDDYLAEHGYPILDPVKSGYTYEAWFARKMLVEKKLPEADFKVAFSIAVRHMARHRGWRNPYQSLAALLASSEHSANYQIAFDLVNEKYAALPEDATVGQIGAASCSIDIPMRSRDASKRENVLSKLNPENTVFKAQLRQVDNVLELRKICEFQGHPELFRIFGELIFKQEKPKVGAELVGNDPLPGQQKFKRAMKASEVFQEFKIRSTVANRRVRVDGQVRHLSAAEQDAIVDQLMTWDSKDERPRWAELAESINLPAHALIWASESDSELSPSRPPVNDTNLDMLKCGIKQIKNFWEAATAEQRRALILEISNGDENLSDPDVELVRDFLADLAAESEELVTKIAGISLPVGRAAYSEDSLKKLNEHMRNTGDDLSESLKAVFHVEDGWRPPAPAIGEPTGQPQVDRVTSQIARIYEAVVSKYGEPDYIIIEHVRDAFMSEIARREYNVKLERHRAQNLKLAKQVLEENPGTLGRPSDVRKIQALRRQNSCCLYCGEPISFKTAEMDHIVPRSGPGSTNTRNNLVAVCRACNASKSNKPFASWAAESPRPGVSLKAASDRLREWNPDESTARGRRELRDLIKDVRIRLKLTYADPPLDGRSMESVAYMARELANRFTQNLKDGNTSTGQQRVFVYQGSITAAARGAAGVDGDFGLRDFKGKSRLDRRHHAVDAAVLALMNPSVARTLAERNSLRQAAFIVGKAEVLRAANGETKDWRSYDGETEAAKTKFYSWKNAMLRLSELLKEAEAADRIRVTRNLRLGLNQGAAHGGTINAPCIKKLGDAWGLSEIERIIDGRIYKAILELFNANAQKGELPEDESRRLWLGGYGISANDEIQLIDGNFKPVVAAHNGYLSCVSAHHVRIYRWMSKKGEPSFGMVRVSSQDLLSHRNEDLFRVELPMESISIRDAGSNTRKAIASGQAEYIGFLTVNDEIEVDLDRVPANISDFFAMFPEKHWTVTGFEDATTINLRPAYLAAEGIPEESDIPKRFRDIIGVRWRISVSSLMACTENIVRRTALGYPRWNSSNGLPISWSPWKS